SLINGYSLPSSHFTVSLEDRVERLRILKSEVTSWKTTSRYSGWMSAFMAAPDILGSEERHFSPHCRSDASRRSGGRQGGPDQALETGLVIAHQQGGIVRPALLTIPVDHGGATGQGTGQLDRDRTFQQLQCAFRLQS